MTSTDFGHAYNINVSLYGDCLTSPNWVQDFVTLADQLQQQLNLRYTHFDCAYRADDGHLAAKTYKYVKQNGKRIRNLLDKSNICGLDYTAAADAVDLTKDAVFSLHFSCPNTRPSVSKSYYQFSLQVVPKVLAPAVRQEGARAFFVALLRQVEELVHIRYGLIQPMEKEKRGGLYFANIFSEHLSQAERQSLHQWVRSQQQYMNKIRDVYWGNVITDDHLRDYRQVALDCIGKTIAPNSIVEVAEGKYFFTLPIDILALSSMDDLEPSRLKVKQVLTQYDMLIC